MRTLQRKIVGPDTESQRASFLSVLHPTHDIYKYRRVVAHLVAAAYLSLLCTNSVFRDSQRRAVEFTSFFDTMVGVNRARGNDYDVTPYSQ